MQEDPVPEVPMSAQLHLRRKKGPSRKLEMCGGGACARALVLWQICVGLCIMGQRDSEKEVFQFLRPSPRLLPACCLVQLTELVSSVRLAWSCAPRVATPCLLAPACSLSPPCRVPPVLCSCCPCWCQGIDHVKVGN